MRIPQDLLKRYRRLVQASRLLEKEEFDCGELVEDEIHRLEEEFRDWNMRIEAVQLNNMDPIMRELKFKRDKATDALTAHMNESIFRIPQPGESIWGIEQYITDK